MDQNSLSTTLDLSSGASLVIAALAIRTAPVTDDSPSATLDSASPDITIFDWEGVSNVSIHLWVWGWYSPNEASGQDVDVSWTAQRDCSLAAVALDGTKTSGAVEDTDLLSVASASDSDLDRSVGMTASGGMCVGVVCMRDDDVANFGVSSPGTLREEQASSGGGSASNAYVGIQTAPGTGSSVTLNWDSTVGQDAVIGTFHVAAEPPPVGDSGLWVPSLIRPQQRRIWRM